MKSDAVIFTGPNQIEFGEVQTPDPGPGDVVVATKHSWISNGTEGSFLRGERWDGLQPWKPWLPQPFPMVPGYQKVGIVESVGSDVEGLKEGQWVFCTINACNDVQFNFAGHIARGPASADQVFALPEGDDPVKYAGLVLTQVGYNGASRPPVDEDCHAVVIGDGQVGLWAAQTLRARGANVALVGMMDFRLSKFKKGDGDFVINAATNKNWLDQVVEWAGGELDIVDDTVGNRTCFDQNLRLIDSLKWGGHFVATGDAGDKTYMDIGLFIRKEITLHCPCAWTRERLETTLQWVHDGKLETLPFITDRFAANDVAKAWDKIATKPDTTLAVILDWD